MSEEVRHTRVIFCGHTTREVDGPEERRFRKKTKRTKNENTTERTHPHEDKYG